MGSLIARLYSRCSSLFRFLYGFSLKPLIAECGSKFRPAFPIKILGGENIKIGNNFRSMGHGYLYANEGKLVIGDNLCLNTNVQIGASGGEIVIGDNVLIGPNVVLRAADHSTAQNDLIRNQPHSRGKITIEDDVWIAANAVILKDVTLHKGCVVAAGSVVTKNVEPYAIVAGVPAIKVSERH